MKKTISRALHLHLAADLALAPRPPRPPAARHFLARHELGGRGAGEVELGDDPALARRPHRRPHHLPADAQDEED